MAIVAFPAPINLDVLCDVPPIFLRSVYWVADVHGCLPRRLWQVLSPPSHPQPVTKALVKHQVFARQNVCNQTCVKILPSILKKMHPLNKKTSKPAGPQTKPCPTEHLCDEFLIANTRNLHLGNFWGWIFWIWEEKKKLTGNLQQGRKELPSVGKPGKHSWYTLWDSSFTLR